MKNKLISAITVLCLVLTACGQGGEYGQVEQHEVIQEGRQEIVVSSAEEEKQWVIEEKILPDADQALADLIPEDGMIYADRWDFINETVYRIVWLCNADDTVPEDEYYKGWFIQKLQSPYTEWVNDYIAPEDWVEGEKCHFWNSGCAFMSEGGQLNTLLKGRQGEYIGQWTEDEGASVSKIDSSLLSSDIFTNKYQSWWRGKDGSFFLYDFDELIHMDSNFDVQNRLKREDGYYVSSIAENKYNGEFYLISPSEFSIEETMMGEGISYSIASKGIQILTADGKQVLLESEDIDAGSSTKMYFTSETEGYLYDNFVIYEFSLKEGEIDLLCDFHNDPVYLDKMNNPNKAVVYNNIRNGIQGGFVNEDGSYALLVACSDGTYQIWHMREDDEQTVTTDKTKQILEWATTFPGIYEELAVSMFNKQSTDYEIRFRLPNQGEDFEDFRTRIQAELSAGGGPDLLTAGSAIDLEAGARQGFLIDLTEFFAEYEKEILPSAWRLGMVDGKRYAVPHSCTITTVVTDKDLVDNQKRWTLDEAMSYMELSGADYFMAGVEEASLFYYLGLYTETNAQLVDWQNGISHLESSTAEKLLEFVGKYADHESTAENQFENVAEGKAMTVILYLGSPNEMRASAAVFENREEYIGFPVENDESGHVINGHSLVVNQSCTNAEGAIEFIKFMLSEEIQFDMAEQVVANFLYGFPVRSSAMEQVYDYLQEESESTGIAMYAGLEYEIDPLSDENIEKLRELIESARPMGEKSNQLFIIIEEELNDYWLEDRSAEQVLDIVDNRAQLYLDETGN